MVSPLRRPFVTYVQQFRLIRRAWIAAMARCGQADGEHPRDGHFLTTYFMAVFLDELITELER